MKKSLFIILLIFLMACDKDKSEAPETAPNHIKYFGFTLIDTYWDDPTDAEVKTNYLDEVSDFTNIADILVVNPSDDIVARMMAMNDVDVQCVLHIAEILFELMGTSSPSGNEYSLRSDYQSRWDEFSMVNNLATNQALIRSFYLGEEPTWNGISFSELEQAADYIKLTVPSVPIMIIEAYPILDELQIPESVDWIGFDHYFVKDPKTDDGFLTELNTLKTKFSSSEQKLVFVMDTHFISQFHEDFGGISLTEMKDVANSYYALAQSQPKTIAILGYFWPSGFDIDSSIGARNMPESVLDNYIRIGKEITGK